MRQGVKANQINNFFNAHGRDRESKRERNRGRERERLGERERNIEEQRERERDTGGPKSYRKYILQNMQPFQYGYAKSQDRFALISESTST